MNREFLIFHKECGNQVEHITADDYGHTLICWGCHKVFDYSYGDDWSYIEGEIDNLDEEGLEAYLWNYDLDKEDCQKG